MSLIVNGTQIDNVVYNGVSLDKVIYNGVVVWESFSEADLIDFEYTTNEDGTYTLTAWKRTYKGEPSTELIIPNSNKIIL